MVSYLLKQNKSSGKSNDFPLRFNLTSPYRGRAFN